MFEPENICEEALLKAATDPRHHPEFYREILESTVYFIRTDEPENKQQPEAVSGKPISILTVQHEGKPYLPFFTSLTRVRAFVPQGAWYLGVKGREFFETTRGSQLMLNPGAECCKLFTKTEIAKLLDGTLFHAAAVLAEVAGAEDEIKLVQPRDYPEQLVAVLWDAFKKRKEVRNAYLAKQYDPTPGAPAHYVIGLEVSGNWQQVAQAACAVAAAAKKEGEVVDFIPIAKDEASEYLLDTEPFYTKKSLWPF